MIKIKAAKAFNLVETILAMVIIAVVAYSLIAVFYLAGIKSSDVETFNTAQSLASGKIEELMTRRFSLISTETETSYSGGISSYSYEIIASYVSAEALEVPLGTATGYKKITVLIRHPKLASPISFEAVRGNY